MAVEFILAFSGGLGSGKSDLTKEVKRRLNWARASFGDQVKKIAAENGRDSSDRAVLQNLGQALVLTQLDQFIEDTMRQAGDAERVILDGVRHVEVLLKLKAKYPGIVKLIHINTPSDIRHERYMKRGNVERRLIARYESDITEAQIGRILPQYADLALNGTLPTNILAEQVISFARSETQNLVSVA